MLNRNALDAQLGMFYTLNQNALDDVPLQDTMTGNMRGYLYR
jgi:hypothetical protein